jgi:hypothetical protein
MQRGRTKGAQWARAHERGSLEPQPRRLQHQDPPAGQGKPLTILITARQRHEQSVFAAVMQTGALKRVG